MRCAKDWILHCMAISNSRTDTGYWMSMKKSKGSWQKMRLRRTMAAAERLFPLLRLFFWEIFVHQQPLLSFLSPRVVSCIVSAGRNHTMARHHDAKRIFCDSARNRSRGRGLFQPAREFTVGNALSEANICELFPDGFLERGSALHKIESERAAFAFHKILQLPRRIPKQR